MNIYVYDFVVLNEYLYDLTSVTTQGPQKSPKMLAPLYVYTSTQIYIGVLWG